MRFSSGVLQCAFLGGVLLLANACGSGVPARGGSTLAGQPRQGSAIPGAPAMGNPFAGSTMVVRKAFTEQVESSIHRRSDLAARMDVVKATSTSLWLDSIAKVQALTPLLEDARHQRQQQGHAVSFSIVVYDLPNRDCAANASNGELHINQDGLNKYKGYIDEIASILALYPDVQIGAIIEPDSLGNLVTNLGQPKCAEAQTAYVAGIAYAVRSLQMGHVALYLDSGHSGWLGWPNNRAGMARVVRSVLDQAGGVDSIRGFATNVSNFTPLVTSGNPQWYDASNPAKDELTFVGLLAQDFADAGITNHHFVIDTARNGVNNARQVWGSWCNLPRAGIGHQPAVAPADGIDAYLWIKPPGEADGTNQGSDPRYDWVCSNQDAYTNVVAPSAGDWFETYFESLVANAPGL